MNVKRCGFDRSQLIIANGAGFGAVHDARAVIAANKLVYAYRRHALNKKVKLRRLQREMGVEEWRRNHVMLHYTYAKLAALGGSGAALL